MWICQKKKVLTQKKKKNTIIFVVPHLPTLEAFLFLCIWGTSMSSANLRILKSPTTRRYAGGWGDVRGERPQRNEKKVGPGSPVFVLKWYLWKSMLVTCEYISIRLICRHPFCANQHHPWADVSGAKGLFFRGEHVFVSGSCNYLLSLLSLSKFSPRDACYKLC